MINCTRLVEIQVANCAIILHSIRLVQGSALGDDSGDLVPLCIIHRDYLPIDDKQAPILSHPDRLDVLLKCLVDTVLPINRLRAEQSPVLVTAMLCLSVFQVRRSYDSAERE